MKEQEKKLIAVLKSGSSRKEKVDACIDLARVGTREAVPVLAGLLADEKLSHMARYALEPISDASVDEALRGALKEVKGRRLVGVIHSIGMRRDVQAVEALCRLLEDPDGNVVQAAARALARINTPGVSRTLMKRLASVPPALRPALADACLWCAEGLLEAGINSEAAAICRAVAGADLPEYVRKAARRHVQTEL